MTYRCRGEHCRKEFDSQFARRIHEGKVHPDEPTEIYENKYWLKREYVEEGLSTKEIADKVGVSTGRILHNLHKHDIPVRGKPSGRDSYHWNEYAEYYTMKSGYEMWRSAVDDAATVAVHRLAAVAWFGLDSVVGRDVHHKNNIPWDNRESNLEPLSKQEHGRVTAQGRERGWHGYFV